MSDATEIRFPDVIVQLTGQDGNVFFLAGQVSRSLRNAGATKADVDEFVHEVMTAENYDAALRVMMRWVTVV